MGTRVEIHSPASSPCPPVLHCAARPETLEATLDKIDKTYGSFDNYLRDALKITDSDLAMIRQRLLEP
jgi:protein tyrosine/serine phosphatase